MDSFTQFNLLEGLLWLAFGGLGVFVYYWKRVPQHYKRMAIIGAIAFFLFGVSDFVEIYTRGFLEPHLWWLLLWKVVSFGTLMITAVWFFVVFLGRHDRTI